jgi:hypothetical protein
LVQLLGAGRLLGIAQRAPQPLQHGQVEYPASQVKKKARTRRAFFPAVA